MRYVYRKATGELPWTSANRDEMIFGHSETFDPACHANNLVYEVVPDSSAARGFADAEWRGAGLGRRVNRCLTLDPDRPAARETAPVGGSEIVVVSRLPPSDIPV